ETIPTRVTKIVVGWHTELRLFRDGDLRGAKRAVAERIALLKQLGDVAGFYVRIRLLHQRLVVVRVERLARLRRDGLDVLRRQRLVKLIDHNLQSLEDRSGI